MTPFQFAGGSVIGTDHRAIPKNNQDAWYVAQEDDVAVAVVCDGCGSGKDSEVGAKLGAALIARATVKHARYGFWSFDLIRDEVLAQLHVLALGMPDRLGEIISDYFLFTVVGVVLSGSHARFFSCGDGLIVVNGEVTQLGPFPDNKPPYLSYGLLAGDSHPEFAVNRTLPQEALDSFLIGCDGAGSPGLLEVCSQDRKLPGTEETAGPISRFWTEDRYFENPDAIRRRLKLIARDWPPRDPERGLLADDTTIVVGRRRA